MGTSLPSDIDALVVGGGAAGLSAATWLGRYQRSSLVVDAGQHRNRFADHVHGLLGRDPITPDALIAEARAGLGQYEHVRVHNGAVSMLTRTGDGRFLGQTPPGRCAPPPAAPRCRGCSPWDGPGSPAAGQRR